MNQETENLIKKIAFKDVILGMLEKEQQGLIISKEIVLQILEELEDNLPK